MKLELSSVQNGSYTVQRYPIPDDALQLQFTDAGLCEYDPQYFQLHFDVASVDGLQGEWFDRLQDWTAEALTASGIQGGQIARLNVTVSISKAGGIGAVMGIIVNAGNQTVSNSVILRLDRSEILQMVKPHIDQIDQAFRGAVEGK